MSAVVTHDGQVVYYDSEVVTHDLATAIAGVTADADRTLTVEAEDRFLSVAAEERVMTA